MAITLSIIEMYAQVIFCDHITNNDDLEVELPQSIYEDGKDKTSFCDLEVSMY